MRQPSTGNATSGTSIMNADVDGFRRLREIARRAMLECGLAPDFPDAAGVSER